MDATDKVISYWTPSDIDHAKHIIAWCLDWDYDAASDLPLFFTPTVCDLLAPVGDKAALDIGCGIGRSLLPMAGLFRKVIGVDISPTMVSMSAEYLKPYPEAKRFIDVRLGDGQTLPVGGACIDFVYSMIVFQHLPELQIVQSYLKEIHRVLKPGGATRIQTFQGPPPNGFDPHWGYFFPSLDAFAAEFESVGLNVVEQQKDVLFALKERRDPIQQDWLWVTATKPY